MSLISQVELTFLNEQFLNLFYSLHAHHRRETAQGMGILNVNSVFHGLKMLYDGSAGQTRQKLDGDAIFTRVIDVGGRPGMRNNFRAALLIPPSCQYQDDFFNQYSQHYVLYKIPLTHSFHEDTKNINKLVAEKYPRWNNPETIFDLDDSYDFETNVNVIHLKYETFPGGVWKNKFDANGTSDRPFNNSSTPDAIKIPMMARRGRDTYLKSYYNPKLNGTWVDMPFTNGYSMLIYLSEGVLRAEALWHFCSNHLSAAEIVEFYRKNGRLTRYNEIYFPKFILKSEYRINHKDPRKKEKKDKEREEQEKQEEEEREEREEQEEDDDKDTDEDEQWEDSNADILDDSSPYLRDIFASFPNLSNISLPLKDPRVMFSSSSRLICHEFGNTVKFNFSTIGTDTLDQPINNNNNNNNNQTTAGYVEIDLSHPLRVNRNFLFFIIEGEKYINSVGIFIRD